MWKSRLFYCLTLLGSTVFFICFNGYLSLYLLVLTLLLPLCSLVLSLPGILGTRGTLFIGGAEPSSHKRKKENIPLELEVWNVTPFAGGRAKVKLSIENTFTGQRQQERFRFTAGPRRQVFQHQLTPQTCGQIICRLERLWVCDYLGIFCLPVGRPQQETVYVYPTVTPLEMDLQQPGAFSGDSEIYSHTKPGDDPSQLFDLREYREGDRPSRIHWKLSQKLEKDLVKEFSLPLPRQRLIVIELNGDGWACDTLLDGFASLSSALVKQEQGFTALFWQPKTRQYHTRKIHQEQDLFPLWEELLAGGCETAPPPLWEELFPEAVSHVLYLSCAPQATSLLALQAGCPGAMLTVIQREGHSSPETPAVDGKYLSLKPGKIDQSLSGLAL